MYKYVSEKTFIYESLKVSPPKASKTCLDQFYPMSKNIILKCEIVIYGCHQGPLNYLYRNKMCPKEIKLTISFLTYLIHPRKHRTLVKTPGRFLQSLIYVGWRATQKSWGKFCKVQLNNRFDFVFKIFRFNR